LAIMAVVGLIGVMSFGMTDLSTETGGVITLLAVLAFTVLLGFVLTGWRCKNRYSSVRFMLWLAFWFVAVSLVSTLVFFTITLAVYRLPFTLFTVLLQLLLIGLILGLCAYVIVLPYMILTFKSSFFRQRFYGCFHLSAMADLGTGGSDSETAKQNLS
ncbi:MAG: hypothetical protein ACYTEO_19100, partial [Planctomycetota bacterium]